MFRSDPPARIMAQNEPFSSNLSSKCRNSALPISGVLESVNVNSLAVVEELHDSGKKIRIPGRQSDVPGILHCRLNKPVIFYTAYISKNLSEREVRNHLYCTAPAQGIIEKKYCTRATKIPDVRLRLSASVPVLPRYVGCFRKVQIQCANNKAVACGVRDTAVVCRRMSCISSTAHLGVCSEPLLAKNSSWPRTNNACSVLRDNSSWTKRAAFHRLRDFLFSARHVKDHDDFNSTAAHSSGLIRRSRDQVVPEPS